MITAHVYNLPMCLIQQPSFSYRLLHLVKKIMTFNRRQLSIGNRMNRKDKKVSESNKIVISVMLAVKDAPAACTWYKKALGAIERWNLGSVIGLEVAGAAFFLGQPENNGWEIPTKLGVTTTRIEVFCNDPDTFIERAVQAGANGSLDKIKNHQAPWGIHRQGRFIDPFRHIWLVGDKSPLR